MTHAPPPPTTALVGTQSPQGDLLIRVIGLFCQWMIKDTGKEIWSVGGIN